MALAEYARAAGDSVYMKEAHRMFGRIWKMVLHPERVGRPILSGMPVMNSLAVPMIVLNLVEELAPEDYSAFQEQVDYCIAQIRTHFVDGVMYENVGSEGKLMPGLADGRLLNPGHAIEAGWFLLHWAEKLGDRSLRMFAFEVVRNAFEQGWDSEHGGLFSFLDARGFAPLQLEWDRKLWWPHCEALYAFLLMYSLEQDPSDWDKFLQVKEYTFSHFPDPEHGEWFGYLDRAGNVSQDFKGGPYKGCFHVPRALWLCWRLLGDADLLA
jgi:N-acylglucosamine 2-epimerase